MSRNNKYTQQIKSGLGFMKTNVTLVLVLVSICAIIAGLVMYELDRNREEKTLMSDLSYWLTNGGMVVALVGLAMGVARLHAGSRRSA
jgi:hypothetical protein